MTKALAFRLDGDYICCRCLLTLIDESVAPNLVIACVQTVLKPAHYTCNECAGKLGRDECIKAAEKLEIILNGH